MDVLTAEGRRQRCCDNVDGRRWTGDGKGERGARSARARERKRLTVDRTRWCSDELQQYASQVLQSASRMVPRLHSVGHQSGRRVEVTKPNMFIAKCQPSKCQPSEQLTLDCPTTT